MTAGAGPRETSTVDQFVFGLVGTANGTEMGIVASSLDTDPVHEEQWWHRLRQHVRLDPAQLESGPYLPRFSFSYFEYDDGTACLLRRSSRGEIGRNYSHALVGSADQLAAFSLSLEHWHWQDGPPATRLDPVELASLVLEHTAWLRDLRGNALKYTSEVVPVVRQLLRDPGRSISVFDCPDDAVLPLLWLTRDVLTPVFAGARTPFPWTFSTYEVRDTGLTAQMPGIVFLCAVPHAGETSRVRVYLRDSPAADDHLTRLAGALVDAYCEDPLSYPVRIEREIGWVPKIHRRVDRLKAVLLGATPTPMPVPVAPPVIVVPASEPVSVQPTRNTEPPRWLLSLSDDQLVDYLAEATRDPPLFRRGLAELRRRNDLQPEHDDLDHARLHAKLMAHGFLVPAVFSAIPGEQDRLSAVSTLVQFACNPAPRLANDLNSLSWPVIRRTRWAEVLTPSRRRDWLAALMIGVLLVVIVLGILLTSS